MQIPSFLLDQWLNEYHFSDSPPEYDLASSTGPHWKLRELLDLVSEEERASLMETELIYSSAEGSVQLREAVAEMHGVSASEVQVLTGASEALLVIFANAAEPGANVVLPFPLFPPTAVVAKMFGLEIRHYHLRPENGFKVEVEEIATLIDKKTKLVLVNSPHNPTGATVTDEECRAIHDLATEHNIQFVSDEVYHPIYHGRLTKSAAALPNATTVGSLSKSLALSGTRCGWIIDRNRKRLQAYTDARGYFTISNPPLAEKFALIAVRNRERIINITQEIATANLELLDQFFADNNEHLGWVRPTGGLTAFPWLTNGGDTRAFCIALAELGVLTAPGDCFAVPSHFRLGFGVSAKEFDVALNRITDYIKHSGLRFATSA